MRRTHWIGEDSSARHRCDPTHYHTVQVEISDQTDATVEQLAEVVVVTEERCPVRNLRVAAAALVMKWSSTPA